MISSAISSPTINPLRSFTDASPVTRSSIDTSTLHSIWSNNMTFKKCANILMRIISRISLPETKIKSVPKFRDLLLRNLKLLCEWMRNCWRTFTWDHRIRSSLTIQMNTQMNRSMWHAIFAISITYHEINLSSTYSPPILNDRYHSDVKGVQISTFDQLKRSNNMWRKLTGLWFILSNWTLIWTSLRIGFEELPQLKSRSILWKELCRKRCPKCFESSLSFWSMFVCSKKVRIFDLVDLDDRLMRKG